MASMNTEPTTTELTIEFPITPAWFQTIRRLMSTASIQTIMDESSWRVKESGGMRLLLSKTSKNCIEQGTVKSEPHNG